MSVHSDEVLTLRVTTADDLDDLADLACATFPLDPQWDYRFPRRKEYPKDHWNCTRSMYRTYMETPGNIINIITIPTEKDGELVQQAVALAVWELPDERRKDIITMGSCEDRRDADFERMNAYANTVATAKKKWFNDVYGTRRLHLRMLGTHPDYQGRGAATQHCRWGMELAREHKVPITLLSSPMGQRLYSRLGFLILASVIVQVEGEEEKMTIGLMVYKGSC